MSSFTLFYFRAAPVLPDAARDDLVGGEQLFWPATTYCAPANWVCSTMGVCRTRVWMLALNVELWERV